MEIPISMKNYKNNGESIMGNIEDIRNLMKDVPEQKLTGVNILFLDISSACTGYCIVNIDFMEYKASFVKAGAIWLDANWTHQQKYSYIASAVREYFWVVEAVDHIVAEQYSINPKKMMGIHVVPEMQGAIKSAAWENGLKVDSILPQTWRSQLQIKKDMTQAGDKVWKIPTKLKVLEYVDVPEQIMSNITSNERRTPFDLYDAVAIALGWLTKYAKDVTSGKREFKFNFKNIKFNNHALPLE